MPDATELYSRWGVDTKAIPTTGLVGDGEVLSQPDFDSKWGIKSEPEKKPQGPIDKLLGINGPRYQLWPEKLAREIGTQAFGAATLPGDVAAGRVDPNDVESFNRMTGGAMMVTPGLRTGAKVGNQLLSVGRRPMTEVAPETAALAKKAIEEYGIPIRGGQMAESRSARMLDSVLQGSPFSGYGKNVGEQRTAFNRAIAKAFGEDADSITPEVMASAKKRLGNKFDEIAERTSVQLDDKLQTSFKNILAEAGNVLPESEVKPIFNQLMAVASKANENGFISGQSYQALTRKGTPLDRAKNSADPNIRFYANQISESLRDALERSATRHDAQELRQARKQYAVMKTVEDLAEKAPTGDISPALLLGKVRGNVDNFAYGGGGELGDLARIGQRFLKEPPNSGTADRLWWMNMLGLGTGGGGLGTMAFYDPVLAAKVASGTALAAGANRLMGAYMASPRYANRLIDNTLGAEMPASAARGAIPYAPQLYLEYSRPAAP